MTSSLFGGIQTPPLPLKWWRHLWTAPKRYQQKPKNGINSIESFPAPDFHSTNSGEVGWYFIICAALQGFLPFRSFCAITRSLCGLSTPSPRYKHPIHPISIQISFSLRNFWGKKTKNEAKTPGKTLLLSQFLQKSMISSTVFAKDPRPPDGWVWHRLIVGWVPPLAMIVCGIKGLLKISDPFSKTKTRLRPYCYSHRPSIARETVRRDNIHGADRRSITPHPSPSTISLLMVMRSRILIAL